MSQRAFQTERRHALESPAAVAYGNQYGFQVLAQGPVPSRQPFPRTEWNSTRQLVPFVTRKRIETTANMTGQHRSDVCGRNGGGWLYSPRRRRANSKKSCQTTYFRGCPTLRLPRIRYKPQRQPQHMSQTGIMWQISNKRLPSNVATVARRWMRDQDGKPQAPCGQVDRGNSIVGFARIPTEANPGTLASSITKRQRTSSHAGIRRLRHDLRPSQRRMPSR